MATEIDVNSGQYTPESMKLRRRLAEAMMKQGTDVSPVAHWTQGAARMVQALLGGSAINDLETRERQDVQEAAAFTSGRYGVTPATTSDAPTSPRITPRTAASTSGSDPDAPLDMALPRSVRTNNPGAMEFGPFARTQGARRSDGRYAVFDDVDAGYRAQETLLRSYMARGFNTPEKIVGRWAPANVDNNSTSAYTNAVAKALGIRPDQPVPPDRIGDLAEAMAAYEAGRPVPRGGRPAAVNAAAIPGEPLAPVAGIAVEEPMPPPAALAGAQVAPPAPADQAPPVTAQPPVVVQASPMATAAAAPDAAVPPLPNPAAAPPAGRATREDALTEAYRRMGARAQIAKAALQSANPRIRAAAQSEIDAAVAAVMSEQMPADPVKRATMANTEAETAQRLLKNQGMARGERRADPARVSGSLQTTLENLAQAPHEYGRTAFERATGPLSGADNHEGQAGYVGAILNAIPTGIARLRGYVAQKWEGGAMPSEVRNRINGDSQAMITQLRPLLRISGEGSQSNLELTQIMSTVGSLAEASSVEEYNRRLEDVRQRINNLNLGANVQELRPQTRSGAGPAFAEEEPRPLDTLQNMEPGMLRSAMEATLRGILGVEPNRRGGGQ